jgi:hypothetical protein
MRKYHIEILLGDFNSEPGRERIFSDRQVGIRVYIRILLIMVLEECLKKGQVESPSHNTTSTSTRDLYIYFCNMFRTRSILPSDLYRLKVY